MSEELIPTQNVNAGMNRIWSFVLTTALLTVVALPVYGQTSDCKNPNQKTYNKKPAFCAPDGTRGAGISLVVNDEAIAIPDVRCSCLPIALRYNNPGVLKTPQGGWKTQMRDSAGEPIADAKGHALFASVEDGIAAWGEWMKRRIEKGQLTTAFQIMSLYAPPDDCVGSIGKPPNCPYGINPTLEYAERVAGAVNKGANEELNLDGADAGGREVLYAVFSAIATFEIGSDFCKSKCKISRELFDKAMDSVWGVIVAPPVPSSRSRVMPQTSLDLAGSDPGRSKSGYTNRCLARRSHGPFADEHCRSGATYRQRLE